MFGLVVSFFIYNQQFLLGYCNFAFGMGLFAVTSALWIERREADGGRWPMGSIAHVTVLAFATYVAHLSAFMTLLVVIGAMTATRIVQERAVKRGDVLGVVPLVPGVLWFVRGFLGATSGHGATGWAPFAMNARNFTTLLTGYDARVDVLSWVVVAVLVVRGAIAL